MRASAPSRLFVNSEDDVASERSSVSPLKSSLVKEHTPRKLHKKRVSISDLTDPGTMNAGFDTYFPSPQKTGTPIRRRASEELMESVPHPDPNKQLASMVHNLGQKRQMQGASTEESRENSTRYTPRGSIRVVDKLEREMHAWRKNSAVNQSVTESLPSFWQSETTNDSSRGDLAGSRRFSSSSIASSVYSEARSYRSGMSVQSDTSEMIGILEDRISKSNNAAMESLKTLAGLIDSIGDALERRNQFLDEELQEETKS